MEERIVVYYRPNFVKISIGALADSKLGVWLHGYRAVKACNQIIAQDCIEKGGMEAFLNNELIIKKVEITTNLLEAPVIYPCYLTWEDFGNHLSQYLKENIEIKSVEKVKWIRIVLNSVIKDISIERKIEFS